MKRPAYSPGALVLCWLADCTWGRIYINELCSGGRGLSWSSPIVPRYRRVVNPDISPVFQNCS